MTRKETEEQIRQLLKSSTITEHNKKMTETLLPIMKLPVLNKMLSTLKKEDKKMKQLSKKRKRVELKYQIMVEKLCKLQLDK